MITKARKLELIQKHGKKFARKSDSRPALQGIHYAQNGSVVVTDTRHMLRIRNAHEFKQPFTADLKTGGQLDGQYPQTDQIWPEKHRYEIELSGYDDVKRIADLVNIAVDLGKKVDRTEPKCTLFMENGDNTLELSVDGGDSFNFNMVVARHEFGYRENLNVTFNLNYLHNILSVFKDAGSRSVSIQMSDARKQSPVIFMDELNEIDAMLLPIRMPDDA